MDRFIRVTVLMTVVLCPLGTWLQPDLRAEGYVDLTYDPVTGSVSYEPANHYFELISQRGLITQVPSIRTVDNYEHFVSVLPAYVPLEKQEIGPLLTPGLTVDELLQDLCVTARTWHLEGYEGDYVETVRLNGQTLHTEVMECVRPPRQFPPMTGERTGLLQYDKLTGDLRLRSQTPIGSLEIISESGIFTGTPNEDVFTAVFDVVRPDKLFKWTNYGFAELDMGPVVKPGLSSNELLADLCINGGWADGGYVTLDYAYPDAGPVPLAVCGQPQQRTEAALSLEYDTQSGRLTVSAADLLDEAAAEGAVAAEKALLMTTLELRSESGIFTGSTASLNGAYDQQSPFRILKQDRDGFASLDLGQILTAGLSADFVGSDVTLDVTFLDPHAVAEVQVVSVPEPTYGLGTLALVVLFALGRNSSRANGARSAR